MAEDNTAYQNESVNLDLLKLEARKTGTWTSKSNNSKKKKRQIEHDIDATVRQARAMDLFK